MTRPHERDTDVEGTAMADSAPNGRPTVSHLAFEDLSTKARIREVALRMFGEHGIEGTSLRAVATAASMSPGLVSHHYGTKANLEQAVLDEVVRRIEDAVRGVGLDPVGPESLAARRSTFEAFLQANPPVAHYLERALTERSAAGTVLARRLLASSRDGFQAMVDAGLARPFPDPDMGAALYWLVTTARFTLAAFADATGLNMADPETVERLRRAEIDLLTRPVFPLTSPDDEQSPPR
jgi:AcrR family transcriptional regulator